MPQRRIFVSYHHERDQAYYDQLSRVYSGLTGAFRDRSLDQEVSSQDTEYVMRRIRENYLTGSSCTVVLCGALTPWRRYVDWEIKATLDKEHGLIGVLLPTNPMQPDGYCYVPDRLNDNIVSGYAVWTNWASFTSRHDAIRLTIEDAVSRSVSLIHNSRQLRRRNG